jgi:quercetin dioxygenase-like cupin family protein
MKKGTEPPPHIHDREDELFYVLAGQLKIFADGKVFTVEAGESAFCRRKRRTPISLSPMSATCWRL